MATTTLVQHTGKESTHAAPPAGPCLMVIFGASGDLTKRLLTPALFNLFCDGLLSEHFVIAGMAMDDFTTDSFRARMTENIRQFNTRPHFDEDTWKEFVSRLYYTTGKFDDLQAYRNLAGLMKKLEGEYQTGGNVLFYMAVPPSVFGLIADNLDKAGFKQSDKGWTRLIIEKPFGYSLESAKALNRELLAHWAEDQIYRIDHYLGKETVQNLLAFRFSNGIFEPLWNRRYVDHIQFSVSETVGVENRGAYYDTAGSLRDVMQNHMFQMLAYLCMEPPASFRAEAVRNEKAKLLEAVRVFKPAEVHRHALRGQYGPGRKSDGSPAVGYRQEPGVNPQSRTDTYAALKLWIDNWRWDGVPVYLRTGKALWKRGTEIVVQFKKAPEVVFHGTPAGGLLEPNRLIFYIQPDQGIEFRIHAKSPGPVMNLQKVAMRFDYSESFEAARGTGYEVLIYRCIIGDVTLFTRTDLVELAWRVAQPILDVWAAEAPTDFPNYPAGSWGPKAAYDLLERDGRHWVEVLNRSILEKSPLYRGAHPALLHNLALMLRPDVFAPGEVILRRGEEGKEMYFVSRGQVEVVDGAGNVVNAIGEGGMFGEVSMLLGMPRTATVRAATQCDLLVLGRDDFEQVLRNFPDLAGKLRENAKDRYQMDEVNW
jgi:glucose-6-phosphate 1-dehydrogenase